MVQRLGFIAFTDTAGVRLPVGEHFALDTNCGVRSICFFLGYVKREFFFCRCSSTIEQ